MRTGILGGTFNPPHLGHLHAAELAHRALNLDRVLFIPTNIPPHKVLPENTASAEDRCEMVRRLTAEKTWAMLDTIEIDRGGASYTVDTLRALHARGETDLHLIVGTDMLLSFDKMCIRDSFGTADALVRFNEKYKNIVCNLLARTVISENMDTALALALSIIPI